MNHLKKRIIFIIPDIERFISGGNLYNQQLVEALAVLPNITVHWLRLEDMPLDKAALEEGIFLVDSLYLEEFSAWMVTKNADQLIYLIVHHLSSMYVEEEGKNIDKLIAAETQSLKDYDGFLATSSFTADYLRDKNLRQPIVVLPPITNKIVAIPSIRSESPIRIIMVANLLPRKGILPFLQILAHRSEAFAPAITIEIIGEFLLNKDYSAACQQLILAHTWLKERVYLRGVLPHKEVQQAYQQANLFISAAAFETFGMALQEAVVFGLPILAVKGGNTANHVVEGSNGFLFDSIELLVDKLIQLSHSSVARKQLLEGAARHRADYTVSAWSEHALQLVKHFSE